MSARKIPISCRYPIRYYLGGADTRGRRGLSQILLSKVCSFLIALDHSPRMVLGQELLILTVKKPRSLGSLTAIPQIVVIYTDLFKIPNFHLLLQMAIRSELVPAESHENDPITFNGLQIRPRIFIFATVFRT